MYKWIAAFAALAVGFGCAEGRTEWERAGRTVERADWSRSGNSLLPDWQESAGGYKGQSRKSGRKTVSKQSYSGRITRISDGDTIHVTDTDGQKHKIRMAHIDAPELNQAYGTRSRDNLAAIAGGAEVTVKVFERDRYGREVAQVLMGGSDLNLQQIRDGAAWHYESYAKKQQDKRVFAAYAAAQKQAEEGRKGLWRDRSPQRPWEWRRQQNTQAGQILGF